MKQLINNILTQKCSAKCTFKLQLQCNVLEEPKKTAKRQFWTENELLKLIQLSVEGKPRVELKRIFKRSTGKIFSKLQKHSAMLNKVKADIEQGLLLSRSLNSSPDQFENLIKYLKIYNDLAGKLQDQKLTQLNNVVPAFLCKQKVNLSQLTQRVTTHGLTHEETIQISDCVSIEIALHQRKLCATEAAKIQSKNVKSLNPFQCKTIIEPATKKQLRPRDMKIEYKTGKSQAEFMELGQKCLTTFTCLSYNSLTLIPSLSKEKLDDEIDQLEGDITSTILLKRGRPTLFDLPEYNVQRNTCFDSQAQLNYNCNERNLFDFVEETDQHNQIKILKQNLIQ